MGFIGNFEVDVANYIFRSGGKDKGHEHAIAVVKQLLKKDVKDHYNDGQELKKLIKSRDLTFQKSDSKGHYKLFTVPCTTTIVPIAKSVFNQIEQAAQVLIVALRAVLQDIYGSASIEESGFIKSLPKDVQEIFIEAIKTSSNYFQALHHPNMKDYPFFDNVGLDLVLVEDYLKQAKSFKELLKQGKIDQLPELPFKILELNAGSPSGASNNMHLLDGLYQINPQALNSLGKLIPNDHFEVLAETYKSLGENWTGNTKGIQVILPPGGMNGATPEIQNLAALSGLVYADPMQLFSDDQGHIRLRTINGSNPIVTAIYSRINADSALFDPKKGVILKDPDSNEPIYLTDFLKIGPSGVAPVLKDKNGKPIPLQSDYAVPGLIDAIVNKKVYLGGLNRVLDNKIILATLTTFAPQYFKKRLQDLGLGLDGPRILTPDTLPPKRESVATIESNPDEWVVKSPNLSGGSGVYILKTLSTDKKKAVLEEIKKNPSHYAYQRLVKIARIPVATKSTDKTYRFANLAADMRFWVFYGAGKDAVPRMTHNALVRYAPQEKGSMSSIVNTSKGGGYAPFVVVDDMDSKEAVNAAQLVAPKTIRPLPTHLPMFVAAQLIQIARLLKKIREKLNGDNDFETYQCLNLLEALKTQSREVLSFIGPHSIEKIYQLIDILKRKQKARSLGRYLYLQRSNQIEIVNLLQILESNKKLGIKIRNRIDELHILNEDLISEYYNEAHRKEDEKSLQQIRGLIRQRKIKDKRTKELFREVVKRLKNSIQEPYPCVPLTQVSKEKIDSNLNQFTDLIRQRLQNSEKTVEFAKIFYKDFDLVDLEFETLCLKSNQSDTEYLCGTQKEFATEQLLTESNFISEDLKSARAEWLQIEALAKKKGSAEREKFLIKKRKIHFAKFPRLSRFQELINSEDVSTQEIIELLPALPYAHYNIAKLAQIQGINIQDLFSHKFEANKVCLLSSRQIALRKLSVQDHAGECFAKKRKSHGLFSDSDIFIWVRKELDPLTQIYTIGHEIIHYHQINETTKMEARALSDGAIAQAQFLNFYGNFLGISNASLESLAADVTATRQPLYGLTDRIVPYFFASVISEIRLAIQKGGDAYTNVLNKYGSLLGYMLPNSTQVRVKALQEIIPALENAKNIRFAKELGLIIPFDEVQSALPAANKEQIRIYRNVINRLISSPIKRIDDLRVIGNHQFQSVSFKRKPDHSKSLTLTPIYGAIALGNSYNQTQQQQQ